MTRSLRRATAMTVTGAALLLAGAVPAAAVPAGSTAERAATGGWRLYRTIAVPGRLILLNSIEAAGPADAWAAGLIGGPQDLHPRALLEHWDGRSWRRVALPPAAAARLGGNAGYVFVAARSGPQPWVFGLNGRYLRLHQGRWLAGRVPVPRRQLVYFDQAVDFGPAGVWAFGVRFAGPETRLDLRPYAARFNGRAWQLVPVPGRGVLEVSAISARDMWAITGASTPGARIPGSPRVLRWTGRVWRATAPQPALPRHATVSAILARAPGSVWVGGSRPNGRTGASELARRWNGRTWLRANPPAEPSAPDRYVSSMLPDGAGGVWALSSSLGSAGPGPARVWHYRRGRWGQPQPLSPRWLLQALAWVPGTRSVWGVAFNNPGLVKGLIILHGPVPR